MPTFPALPATHVATRTALHAVAEQVLAKARHDAVGKIGLAQTPGGFATPAFPGPAGPRVVAVEGVDLVVSAGGAEVSRGPLTTIAAAAQAAGAAPGAAGSYTPATTLDPDRALDLDPDAAAVIDDWFALGQRVLTAAVESAGPQDDPSAPTLWPEHFDLAIVIGAQGARANVGASPGDGGHEAPYLYVGPWEAPSPDPYWDATTFPGAQLPYDAVAAAADPDAVAIAFVQQGLGLLNGRT